LLIIIYNVSIIKLKWNSKNEIFGGATKKKFKKTISLPVNYQFDEDLNFAVDFMATFLAMYNSHMKKFEAEKYKEFLSSSFIE
jgi:hypothetical protein